MKILELNNVYKTYKSNQLEVPVLFSIDLNIEEGDMVAVVGPSGSGKSTLMNIIGLLDRPTTGELKIAGEKISLNMSDKKLAKIRSEKIGFVFQTFNLLPKLSALENILTPTIYSKKNLNYKKRAMDLLTRFGLKGRLKHKPPELSGGERQRIAIARALINNPEIILADEPTGNLDSKSGKEILKTLKELNKEGKTVIIITHDPNVAKECNKTIRLFDGKITDKESYDRKVKND